MRTQTKPNFTPWLYVEAPRCSHCRPSLMTISLSTSSIFSPFRPPSLALRMRDTPPSQLRTRTRTAAATVCSQPSAPEPVTRKVIGPREQLPVICTSARHSLVQNGETVSYEALRQHRTRQPSDHPTPPVSELPIRYTSPPNGLSWLKLRPSPAQSHEI